MRIALVANDRSGGRLAPEELAGGLRNHGHEVVIHSIRDLARVESAAGVDRLVVVGGDGSVGPCAELAGRLGVALAVIPGGTANDFARAHGLPLDPAAAIELAARSEATQPLELGRLGERPFVNVVSAGLAPTAARHARIHKPKLGPLAYPLGALKAGVTAHPIACDVWIDGREVFQGHAWQIIVSVSGAFGGGSQVGDADPSDGRLHVTVVPEGPRIGLIWRAVGMRRGDLAAQPDVAAVEGRRVDLGLPGDADVNVDGELCRPDRLSVEAEAFSLVVKRA